MFLTLPCSGRPLEWGFPLPIFSLPIIPRQLLQLR